jgi:hypothetical protein
MLKSIRTALVTSIAVLSLGVAMGVTDTANAATAATSTSCTTTAAPTAAKLRLTITSTASTANIHLAPGQVTGRVDRTLAGGATTGYVADGVQVKVPTGQTGTVTTDVILVDPSQAQQLALRIDKTSGGTTKVVVTSLTAANKTATLTTSSTAGTVNVARSVLFDPTYALPKADDRKLVLAAYYPWFTATNFDPLTMSERPLNARSVWSPAGVLSMTQQAKAAGIDGFVISWMGATHDGSAWDVAANAAAQSGNFVAPYLEIGEAMNRGGVPTVEAWLKEALDRTGPASVTNGGVPVVFVWNMAKVSAADWTAILARLGRPVKLVGDGDTSIYGSSMWGFHAYLPPADLTGSADRNTYRNGWFRGGAALDPTAKTMANITTVSPGFDDRLLRGALGTFISRLGGRYDATWDAALAGDPDMVLVTSWNEWFEGSEVEPGTVNGSLALDRTKVRSAAWKGTCTAPVVTTATTALASTTTTKKKPH